MLHVKSLAFRIVKYLLDGMIDGVIKEKDLNNFKDSKNKHEDDEAIVIYVDKIIKRKMARLFIWRRYME